MCKSALLQEFGVRYDEREVEIPQELTTPLADFATLQALEMKGLRENELRAI